MRWVETVINVGRPARRWASLFTPSPRAIHSFSKMRFSTAFTLVFLAASVAAHAERKSYAIPETRHGVYLNSEQHKQTRKLRSRADTAAAGSPQEIALQHLKEIAPGAEVRLRPDHYTDEDTGIWHGYYTQTLNGIDVKNAQANVNVNRDGSILSSGSSLLKGKVSAPPIVKRADLIDPLDALEGAIVKLGYPLSVDNAEAVPETPLTGNGQSYVLVGVEGAQEVCCLPPPLCVDLNVDECRSLGAPGGLGLLCNRQRCQGRMAPGDRPRRQLHDHLCQRQGRCRRRRCDRLCLGRRVQGLVSVSPVYRARAAVADRWMQSPWRQRSHGRRACARHGSV